MLPPAKGYSRSVSLALGLLFGATSVWGQAQPDQTLDQVDAFDSIVVLDMAFVDPSAPEASVPDFTNLGVNGGGGVASCKIAPNGLYCLATVTPALPGTPYQVVRFWADPKAKPLESIDLLRCDDSALGLQIKPGVPGPCTGLTVDLAGAIWVTGSQDGKDYRLLKIDRQPAVVSCSAPPWQPLTSGTNLCRAVVATGQGVLSDIDAVDADAIVGSASWTYGPVILGVRNTVSVGGGLASDVVMFNRAAPASPATAPNVVFGSWGLAVGERLQSASVLQVPQAGTTPPVNYVLAATSVLAGTGTGRILARDASAIPTNTSPVPPPLAFNITNWEAANSGLTINLGYSDWLGNVCQNFADCTIMRGSTPVARLTSTGGTMARKTASSGAVGLGVNGATAGEIDINESINVAFSSPRKVSTIEVLFLYNGPEFSDKAEIATITADGVPYRLSMRAENDNDNDDTADWTGPGSVAKCGTATSSGTGCLLIINPFPGPVTNVTFGAADAATPPWGGTNNSDYSIGRIETANYVARSSWTTGLAYLSDRDYQRVIALGLGTGGSTAPFPLTVAKSTKAPNLDMALRTGSAFPDGISVAPGVPIDLTVDCPTPIDSSGNGGCPVALADDGTTAAKLGNVTLAGTSTASGVTVYKVENLLDCRYQPQVQACYKLLNPSSGTVTDVQAEDALITAGWIDPVTTNAIDRLSPAAQRLNVTPQLPEDVTAGFPLSGPGSLPNLYISQRYRGRDETDYKFDALFFKTEAGVYFTGTYAGEFDVFKLTGVELGCNPYPTGTLPKAKYFEWDTITTVSETWIGVGSRYIDTLINVGCRNPTKVSGGRTSLFPILEIAPDTYGPTVKSTTPSVTLNNDGAFARLTQSLYDELKYALDQYTCLQVDATGAPPLSSATCSNLRTIWSAGKPKLDKCVNAAFQPKSSASNENCQAFRIKLDEYKASLPATPSGTDLANRLAEQYYRWEVIKHVFETRFLPSIPSNGYCRENNKCGNTSLD